MKLLTQKNNHVFVCGMTRSGKTYFSTKAMSELPCGVLFFNIQNAEMPKKFIMANAEYTSFEQLIKALRSGTKIDMRFPAAYNMDQILKVIGYISKKLMRAGFSEQNHIYVGYDECQVLEKDALLAVRDVATRGLAHGIRCIFISQRPALADMTLYTQSSEHYIFRLGNGERTYFKGKGIDYDVCLKAWEENGDHSYVYFDGFILEGRKAV